MTATSTTPAIDSYFLPYQEAWIDDEATLKLSEKSRRVGFTFASSYRMFKKCMTRRKFTQWVSSRDMFTAQELIKDYVSKWCELSNIVASGMYGDNVVVVDPDKNIKAFVCEFPATGSRIVSLASTPEAFAGKGGDVFLDEVDLHQDSGRLIDMAMPCITWGNQLEAVSAYRVDGSRETPWARMVEAAKGANPQNASLHTVSIHDAVAQGLVEKINEVTGKPVTREEFIAKMRALCRTLAAWQSQFELIVQDAGGRLLTLTQIMACELPAEELAAMLARYPDAPRYGGYDVARRTHASAWHEFAKIGVTLVLARRETWRNVSFDAQEAWIETRLTDKAQPRIHRMAIDSTGIGMQMAERMAKKFPGRIDEVNLESSRRHELCMLLADRYENRRILIPADEQLRADLNAPLKTFALNGGLRIDIPAFRTEAGEISHADEFMASVLAVSAGEGGSVPAARGVSTRRSRLGGRRGRRSFVA